MLSANSVVGRAASTLLVGSLVGTGAGAVAGAAEMAVAGALTADDALLGAFVLALYGAGLGAVFGGTSGFALGLVLLPLSTRPRIVRRLRLVWGACTAVIVFGLCFVTFGSPDLAPGANETMANVQSDLLWFYVAPSVLAFAGGAILAPLVARAEEIATS
jgi:hypothetical protein